MRKLIIIISIIGIITGVAFLNANAQGFGLTPPGPQPYQYQPYSQQLNNPSIGAENPNATESEGGGFSFWGLGWIRVKVIGFVLFAINYIIGLIGSILFTLAGFFVEIGLYFNVTILETFAVQLGWRIMRDLANLGFVIGIVVIAYATILGIEDYNIKKTLFSFIIAAVMVNFSFSIAGVLIDASNIITHFFISKSIGGNPNHDIPPPNPLGSSISVDWWTNSGPHQLALSLASAFGPQRLLVVNKEDFGSFEAIQSEAGMITMVVATFFIALFTILASLGMLAVGAAMLYRFIVLSALIILMPAAVLAWAFRKTGAGEKPWGMWWNNFFSQLIYLPFMMFFIYLSITLVTIQGAVVGSGQLSIRDLTSVVERSSGSKAADALALSGGAASKILGVMSKPLEAIVEMILLLALLFYGITQSHKLSGVAGNYFTSKVEGMRDWLISAKGSGAREWAQRKVLTLGSEPDKNLGNQLANVAAKIPFAGGVVNALKKYTTVANTNVEGYAKEYNSLNDNQLLSKARNPDILLDAEKMAGMAKTIAQRGKLSTDPTKGLTMQEFDKFISPAKRFGLDKEVLKAAPHLFERFGWDTNKFNKFMDNDFKPDDMDKVSADALKDKRVAFRLTNAHLKRLDAVNKKDHRKNFIAVFNNEMTDEQRAIIMGEQFKNKKDIDDLHQDFFASPKFSLSLKGVHVDRLRENGNFKQQYTFIKTLADISNDPTVTDNVFNELAQPIIDKKRDNGWTGIMNNPETKSWFDTIETEYNQRNNPNRGIRQAPPQPGGGGPRGGRAAGGGAGPRIVPPGNNPLAGGGGAVNPPPGPGIPPGQIPPQPQQGNRFPNIPI